MKYTELADKVELLPKIPESVILFLARLSLAAIFWLSAQTKIDGLVINFVTGEFALGWPSIKETTFYLFEYEYALPIIPPVLAAYLATFAEHILPILLLVGFASRLAALGLFVMTMTIQIFVYPDAYATHLTWATLALLIVARGPGVMSLDHLVKRAIDDWI
ncbi:DoxX family protein [Vibrio sp. WJH972]